MSALLLSLALRALVAAQPSPPAPLLAAVRRAVGLRLAPDEVEADAAIGRLRAALAASTATVEVVDYGAGTRGDRSPTRRVADVYAHASSGPLWGRVMFGLVRALRPVRVLELGTNLGVSAAHIGAGLALNEREDRLDDEPPGVAGGRPAGRLVTLEGAPELASLALRHLAALGHGATAGAPPRVEVVVGPFTETLAETCAAHGPFDLVFVDGHHEEEAALSYVDAILPHLAPGAVVVLDDVEPRRPVARAWRRLRAAHPDAPAVYLGKWGLIALGGPASSAAPLARTQGAATGVARPTGSTPVVDARP